MTCKRKIDDTRICGHGLMRHDAPEDGMGGANPCMVPGCPCADYSPVPADPLPSEPYYVPRQQLTPGGPVHGGFTVIENPTEPFEAQHAKHEFKHDNSSGKTVQKWADPAMFTAQPIDATEGPKVRLLWMTPDPLGVIAAACKGYKGEFVDHLSEVTDAEREEYFEQVQKTHLKAPFEFVQFHFSISGVTRAFTHQLVRQRTATFVQESLRFAVKEDMPVGLPPSLAGTDKRNIWERGDPMVSKSQRLRDEWDSAIEATGSIYESLVNQGLPAEDARGLLPTNILTRVQYRTDLRALLEHGGNRLCTQAQFEWRTVFSKYLEAIRNYDPVSSEIEQWHSDYRGGVYERMFRSNHETHKWQYERIADVFRPVCYLTGKCEFKASFDRACSIRNRVDANAEIGRSSERWHEEHDAVVGNPVVSGVGPESVVRNEQGNPVFIGAIRPAEWLLDPGAAR